MAGIQNPILPGFHPDRSICRVGVSPDSKAWQNIGSVLDMARLSDDFGSTLCFPGAMVGLCAQDTGGTQAIADFDYFDYHPNSA